MLKLRNNLTGQIEDVPESQIAELVQKGSHSLPKNIKIPVISPDGQPGTIDSSEAYTAFQSGFQYDTPEQQKERQEEAEFGNRPISAGAAGAARGLTFGLSDQALVKSGAVEPDTLNQLKERNPEASIIGEAGGIVLPTVVTGGAGLVGSGVRGAARAGLAAEGLTAKALSRTLLRQGENTLAKKVLATAATKGAGSAVEGAFYGAGHIISEDALGNADLNAESLMANMGAGAIIGGAAGSVLGLGARGAAGAIDLSKQAIKPAQPFFRKLIGAADEAEEGTILTSLSKKKHDIDELRRAASELEVKLTPGAESANPIVRDAESILNETPSVWGEEVKKAHERVRSGIQGKAEKILEEATPRTEQEVGERIKDEILQTFKEKYDPFKAAYAEIQSHRPMIELDPKSLNRIVNNINKLGGQISSKGGDVAAYTEKKALHLGQQTTVEDLANFISEVKADSRAYMRAGQDRLAYAAREVARSAERLHDRTILREALKLAKIGAPGAEEAARQLVNAIRTTNKEYAGFMQFLGAFGKEAKLGKVSNVRQLTEKLEDLAPEQIVKKFWNPKNSQAMSFFKENFPSQFEEMRKLQIAKIAAKVAKEDPVHGASIDINKLVKEYYAVPDYLRTTIFGPEGARTIENIEKVHRAMPGISNPSRTDIRNDFTKLLTPILNLRDMAMVGLLKVAGSGSKEAYTVKGINSLAEVERSQKNIGQTIRKGIDQFMKGSNEVSKRAPAVTTNALMDVSFSEKKAKDKDVEAAYERHSKQLAEMSADPSAAVMKLNQNTSALALTAPKTAAALQMKAQNAIIFLNSKLPQNPAAKRSSSLIIKQWKPSTVEMRKFERYLRAVDKPMSVIKDLERGALNREGVETLKAVYPELYNQIVSQVVDRVAELRVNLPYSKRLLLGTLLDVPIDTAQEPQFLAAIQAQYQQQGQTEQEQGAIKPTAKGVSNINMAQATQTETQRLQNRT